MWLRAPEIMMDLRIFPHFIQLFEIRVIMLRNFQGNYIKKNRNTKQVKLQFKLSIKTLFFQVFHLFKLLKLALMIILYAKSKQPTAHMTFLPH